MTKNPNPSPGERFRAFADEWRPAIERRLEEVLPPADEPPAELHAAMRHAMFPGGKRLRPLLALLAARVTGGEPRTTVVAAAGLELVHTYSLVHDDLPCMDDDDLRRGRAACHVEFGEATALLAGDALLTLGFEAVAVAGGDAVAALAKAAGSRGMVGGQVGDLAAEGRVETQDLTGVEWIHDRKTAALIAASLEVGAIAGGGRLDRLGELRRYGNLIGRAFQVADDCLDVVGSAAELGKRPGQDAEHRKATYPAVLGVERSLAEAGRLAREAADLAPAICAAGSALDTDVELLQDLAFHIVARKA